VTLLSRTCWTALHQNLTCRSQQGITCHNSLCILYSLWQCVHTWTSSCSISTEWTCSGSESDLFLFWPPVVWSYVVYDPYSAIAPRTPSPLFYITLRLVLAGGHWAGLPRAFAKPNNILSVQALTSVSLCLICVLLHSAHGQSCSQACANL
jgi:hypothetical protein